MQIAQKGEGYRLLGLAIEEDVVEPHHPPTGQRGGDGAHQRRVFGPAPGDDHFLGRLGKEACVGVGDGSGGERNCGRDNVWGLGACVGL